MRGMNQKEFALVMDMVQTYHKFAAWRNEKEQAIVKEHFPLLDEYGFNIKYVDVTYDTRTGDYWCVTFRQGSTGVQFKTNQFGEFNKAPKGYDFDNLFDACMAYLKGEFEPGKEFEVDLRD